jgi:ABC-type uncharacterized transport system fused permease/ATPase subunit
MEDQMSGLLKQFVTTTSQLGWIWNSTNMIIQFLSERHRKVLDEIRKAKKRIYKKKYTPVRTLVKVFHYKNQIFQSVTLSQIFIQIPSLTNEHQ